MPQCRVEIDLLRSGTHLPALSLDDDFHADYRLVVSRTQQRPLAALYSFGIRDPIPDIPIPLRIGETEPLLRLNAVLHQLYDEVRYDLAIDYNQPLDLPFDDDDASWVGALLTQSGTV